MAVCFLQETRRQLGNFRTSQRLSSGIEGRSTAVEDPRSCQELSSANLSPDWFALH
jgi:hypothetical protein